jgi:hypothetical protein
LLQTIGSKYIGRTNTELLCAKIIAVIQKSRVIAKTKETMSGKGGLPTRGMAAGMARRMLVKTRVGRKSVTRLPSKTVSGRKRNDPKIWKPVKETEHKASSKASNEEEVEEIDAEVVGRKREPGGEEEDDDADDTTKIEVIPEVDGGDLHHNDKKTKPVLVKNVLQEEVI